MIPAPLFSMREFVERDDLLGPQLAASSWAVWKVLLIAIMGEPLSESEAAIFRDITGFDHIPGKRCDEVWLACGRRAGKTRIVAVLITYLSSCYDYRARLAPGERATIPCMSATAKQARKLLQYIIGNFETVAMLRPLVQRQTAILIELTNQIDIEIRPSNFRSIRGDTCAAGALDEIAFFYSEETSANPDHEIVAALRPSLATLEGPLIAFSSPYAKRGELYSMFKRYGDGHDRSILVIKAPTRTLNPSLPQRIIDRAVEQDAAKAASEFGGEFRNDIDNFLDREIVESLVIPGRRELPRSAAFLYEAFIDPSGGGADSYVAAIAHNERGIVVLDAIREIAPGPSFNTKTATAELAAFVKTYNISLVHGDKYAGEWPADEWLANGIQYEFSERSKSELYIEGQALLNGGKVELLDHPKTIDQICNLERRNARGTGKPPIDHRRISMTTAPMPSSAVWWRRPARWARWTYGAGLASKSDQKRRDIFTRITARPQQDFTREEKHGPDHTRTFSA